MSQTNSCDFVAEEKPANTDEGLNSTINEDDPPQDSTDTFAIKPTPPSTQAKKNRTPKQLAAYERMNKARMENVEKRRVERRNIASANIRTARGIEEKEARNLQAVLDPFITLAHYQNECIEDLQRARRVARKPAKRRVRDVDESLPDYDGESDTDEESDADVAEPAQTKSILKKGEKPPAAATSGPIQRSATPPQHPEPPAPSHQAQRMYSYMSSLGY